MERIPVSSSNLRSVGYDVVAHILEVEFQNSRVYQYFGVPQDIHDALMNAASHGSYFYWNLRSCYRYSRVR
jgi:hypothetical protein